MLSSLKFFFAATLLCVTSSSACEAPLLDAKVFGSIQFATVRNEQSNRAYVVSTQNFIDDTLRVPHYVYDSRCPDLLLYFKSSDDIRAVFSRYNIGFKYRIARSQEVPSSPLVLEIKDLYGEEVFAHKLCADVLPAHIPSCFTSKLRFAVCSEDIGFILSRPGILERFEAADVLVLREFSKKKIERRLNALLGQDILQKFDSIQIGQVTLYFHHKKLSLESGWEHLEKMCSSIKYLIPHDSDIY